VAATEAAAEGGARSRRGRAAMVGWGGARSRRPTRYADSMTVDIIVTVVAGIFLALAAFGAVLPVLPGSPIAFVTLIVWGWVLNSAASWTAAGIGAFFALVGFSAAALLTGRKLKKERIPKRSILAAVIAGIVGTFVIPFFGLFIGFALGLFVAEYMRGGDEQAAMHSSWEALKAMGLGMAAEFFMVALAGSVWTIGVIVHFATV
jgi:uncharacterized protein